MPPRSTSTPKISPSTTRAGTIEIGRDGDYYICDRVDFFGTGKKAWRKLPKNQQPRTKKDLNKIIKQQEYIKKIDTSIKKKAEKRRKKSGKPKYSPQDYPIGTIKKGSDGQKYEIISGDCFGKRLKTWKLQPRYIQMGLALPLSTGLRYDDLSRNDIKELKNLSTARIWLKKKAEESQRKAEEVAQARRIRAIDMEERRVEVERRNEERRVREEAEAGVISRTMSKVKRFLWG